MRFGKGKEFRTEGIRIAIEYFQIRGHEVIGFIPDYVMDRKKIQMQLELKNKKRSKSAHVREIRPQQIPDDVSYLESLNEMGILVKTPA